MTFSSAQPIVPSSIGGIQITLYVNPHGLLPNYTIGLVQSANYEVEVLDASGVRIRIPGDLGDLIPHLTPDQINGLLQLMADLRVKAENEILGR